MGRPVLGTYIAGVPELVENGVTGWLVPAGNIVATAEAVQRILATPTDQLSAMGRAGTTLVRTMHDANQEAAKLLELFRSNGDSETSTGNVG